MSEAAMESTPENTEITQEVIQETNQETHQDTQETEVQVDTQPERTPGWNRIDFKTASPEDIERRFGRMYAQVKSLEQYRDIAAQQAQAIEDLRNGQYQLANHLTNKAFKETESQVNAELKTAIEMGDAAGIAAATSKLVDLRTQQRESDRTKQQFQQQPQPQFQQPQFQDDGFHVEADIDEVAEQAIANGQLSRDEAFSMKAWAQETNERGEPLRPWIRNSTGDPKNPDPDYAKAWILGNQIFNDPKLENLNFNEKLALIDKKMGVTKMTGGQTVMKGRLQTPAKNANIKLSPEVEAIAEKIAIKTNFGGSKFKNDQDRIKAYREQMAAIKGAKK